MFQFHPKKLLILVLICITRLGFSYNITFRVDMNNEVLSTNGIHIGGNFQSEAGFPSNWDPSTTQMLDNDGDNIFEITLDIPAGYWEFKYINGNVWPAAENAQGSCTVGGTNNRFLTVSNSDSILEIVVFNKCPQNSNSSEFSYPDTTGTLKWWNERVFYEIFVRSFADSDGDGIGDFQGIIDHINYLNDNNPNTNTDLGIGGIWLMPMMESSSYHGYDVEDYYSVEQDYGTISDFQRLLDTCHAHGINVIIDLVINHCSNKNPWYIKSAQNDAKYANWFRWDANPPTDLGPWGQTLWHWNSTKQSYYYGLFWSGMPDLNYEEPAVFEEVKKITKYWLDMGVDGFRLDAIKYLDEGNNSVENTPETFNILYELRNYVESINPDAFMVGEVWDATSKILPYVSDTTLNSCFDFDLAGRITSAVSNNNISGLQQHLEFIQSVYPRSQYSTFLTNHDQDRIYSVLNDVAKMKLAASVYLSLPGIPFVYYGEEIALTGTGDHLNIRTPMQWNGNSQAGFTSATPWRGFAQDYKINNVMLQQLDSESIWNHYHKWINLRNNYDALKTGIYWPVLYDNSELLSYIRTHARGNEEELIWIIHNTGENNVDLDLPKSIFPLESGTYYIYDAFNKTKLGNILVNDSGDITEYSTTINLNGQSSNAFLISDDESLSINADINNIHFYPNPVNDILHINSLTPLDKVTVLSIIGAVLKTRYFKSKKSIKLSITDLPSGAYLLNMHSINGINRIEKFIKIN